MADITVRPETGADMRTHPLAEMPFFEPAQRTAMEEISQPTIDYFEAFVSHWAGAIIEEAGDEQPDGLLFSVLNAQDDRYPGLQIAFDWKEPAVRTVDADGKTVRGSIFFTQETLDGRDVLSYSLVDTPYGLTIEGAAGRYDGNFDVHELSSARFGPEATFAAMEGLPGISNAEITTALGYAAGAVTGSAATAQEGPSLEAGGSTASAAHGGVTAA